MSERRCTALLWLLLVMSAGCGIAPDVIIEVEGEAMTSERGGSVTVSVQLARRPSRTILVRAVSSDASEGTTSDALTFDRNNWNVSQTVTITGVDDLVVDGDVAYSVTFEASVQGVERAPREAEVLEVINRDDDRVSFETLGDLPGGAFVSFVFDMSASGAVVVGYSSAAAGDEAVRFTREQGLQGLGGAPSHARAVSPDGTVIAGFAAGEDPEAGLAVWRGGPLEFWRGGPTITPGAPPLFRMTSPWAVLDTAVVYGTCFQTGVGAPLGCFQEGPGLITLVSRTSEVFAADDRGNVVGARYGFRTDPTIAVAVRNATDLPYPADAFCITPGACAASAHDFSTDAETIVGLANLPRPRTDVTQPAGPYIESGFVFTSAEGMVRLADVPDGLEASGALTISDDARVIGGFGSDAGGRVAVVWVDRVPNTLADVVARAGGTLPTGFVLLEVVAISSDGLTLAGNGINAAGDAEGFRVTLPSAL